MIILFTIHHRQWCTFCIRTSVKIATLDYPTNTKTAKAYQMNRKKQLNHRVFSSPINAKYGWKYRTNKKQTTFIWSIWITNKILCAVDKQKPISISFWSDTFFFCFHVGSNVENGKQRNVWRIRNEVDSRKSRQTIERRISNQINVILSKLFFRNIFQLRILS